MPKISGAAGEGVQSVVLVLRILETLAQAGKPLGVTTLAQELGTTKSRIHRHLRTLVQEGYVGQAPETERYLVGPRLVTLGRAVSEDLDLANAATSALQELRDSLGHFSVVSQMDVEGVRVLKTVSGKSAIEIGVRQGSLLSFHGSAQGKVALAFGPPELRSRVLRSRLDMLTPHTVVSASTLDRELEQIRERGWAVAPNEAMIGINTLAAPILDVSNAVVGTVGIVDSIQYIEAQPSAEQIRRIVEAGRRISQAMGHRG
ncbi:IclR family transcriptional regulator [Alsobacter sp. KACC 23698]|uniref:IclR family transcriptional regulator n=1 Tax=Alsobacter sp. KACC 23698 TaxID=3149229 RepID=A0AAU7JCK4_9HYPH